MEYKNDRMPISSYFQKGNYDQFCGLVLAYCGNLEGHYSGQRFRAGALKTRVYRY